MSTCQKKSVSLMRSRKAIARPSFCARSSSILLTQICLPKPGWRRKAGDAYDCNRPSGLDSATRTRTRPTGHRNLRRSGRERGAPSTGHAFVDRHNLLRGNAERAATSRYFADWRSAGTLHHLRTQRIHRRRSQSIAAAPAGRTLFRYSAQ